MRSAISAMAANEQLNFLLTNRIPRRLATNLIGWFSKIENPIVARTSIALWRLFSNIDLSDAATTHFPSMHACFTRRLRPDARPFDRSADILASPCDAIVGAQGRVEEGQLHQIKGAPYSLTDLLGDAAEAARFAGGNYLTLRLTAGMYHHFHAPHDLTVERVDYMSGDCWNVNPAALKRVERLFCKNERAAIYCRLSDGTPIILVAVAAILVACIRLTFLATEEAIRTGGSRSFAVDAVIERGAEMGWFEHGSTIVMLAPAGCNLMDGIEAGVQIRAGQRLMRLTGSSTAASAGHP